MSRYFAGPCFCAPTLRDLDRRSAELQGLSEFGLMELAGAAAFRHLLDLWPATQRVAIFCGTGNNGGDGWIIARLLLESGLNVDVFLFGTFEKITGTAQQAYDAWFGMAHQPPYSSDDWLNIDEPAVKYDVVVDALVGIGIRGPTRPDFCELVDAVNRAAIPVLSLDVPSGLNADTGAVEASVIAAQATITFVAMKPGLLTGQAPDAVGDLILDCLGTPLSLLEAAPLTAKSWASDLPSAFLTPRRPSAHKGSCGHVLVVGGNVGMGGASILAASAALRGGAGLVTLATRSVHLSGALARHPEVMARDIDLPEGLSPLLQRASAVVIGPGLGVDEWSRACLRLALESAKPLVIDADGLNLLATDPSLPSLGPGSVLTPHPGEAARLAKVNVPDIESDRLHWAKSLAEQYGTTIILKGAGSIVASLDDDSVPNICSSGNPGMATGGMGDVLAGLVGALLGQGYEAPMAALGGAIAHAAAGDRAWRDHGLGLTATDVVSHLGAVLTPELFGTASR